MSAISPNEKQNTQNVNEEAIENLTGSNEIPTIVQHGSGSYIIIHTGEGNIYQIDSSKIEELEKQISELNKRLFDFISFYQKLHEEYLAIIESKDREIKILSEKIDKLQN